MKSEEIRRKFLDFFAKKGHTIIPSSSLLPTDPSVLFTTAGMQQFKEYFLGKESPYGPKITSCQKCFRTSDIEEIGNQKHLTFVEMLGNFSFGEYFKEEAIKLAYEFLFEELKLSKDEAFFTIFEGDKNVPEDKESILIWKKLGIKEDKIKRRGREDNFWGPTGEEGPCGPATEIHFGDVEVWNLVFNEYYQDRDQKLTLLKQKGVDTGMGLERLAMIVQGKNSVFETDLFEPILKDLNCFAIKKIKDLRDKELNKKAVRIIADHIKSSVFLISEGILPSNVERGYVLRRLLRRIIRYGKLLNLPKNFSISLAQKVIEIYKFIYPEVKSKETDILTVIQNEEEKFEKTLERGLKQFEKITTQGDISGGDAFHLYDTYGFPLELTKEIAIENNLKIDDESFQKKFKEHQDISRAGVKSKFGGVGEWGERVASHHSATHLLHQALRLVLGDHVQQAGSDLTPERIRFDFTHQQKMTESEIKKVEEIVNEKIKENLEIKMEEMIYSQAIDSGALAFFKEKYPEKVKVYSIGEFSKEICAGPHAKNTKELGEFKIIKEKASGAGIRRIKAVLIK